MVASTQNQQTWVTLGIDPTCSKEQIKARWRKLIKENHPDFGGTEENFLKIQQAYKDALYLKDLQTTDTFQPADNPEEQKSPNPAAPYQNTTETPDDPNNTTPSTKKTYLGTIRAAVVMTWVALCAFTSFALGQKYGLALTQTGTLLALSVTIPFLTDRIFSRWWAGILGWVGLWVVIIGWGYGIPWIQ